MSGLWSILFCLLAAAAGAVVLQHAAMSFAKHVPDSPGLHGPRKQSQHLAGDVVAAVIGLGLAALLLLLTGRPFAAALLSISVFLFLGLFNYAKLIVLREPLILADAWLLPQVFRYPHLYFPFLPVRAMIVSFAALCACLSLLFYLEDNRVSPAPLPFKLLLLAMTSTPALLLVLMRLGKLPGLGSRLLRHCPVSHDPMADALRCGPLAAAMLHPVLAGAMENRKDRVPDFLRTHEAKPAQSSWPEPVEALLSELERLNAEHLPHILLIQAESLYDIRDHLRPEQNAALGDFLPNLDMLKTRGQLLPTPESAFGAYTMRTEFSMLTGLQLPVLGPFAHNPYLAAGRRPFWSLARHLDRKGYDTICLHPYAKDFFHRDRVMPNLGFRHFIGMGELRGLERFGPYVSDGALGQWMIDKMERSGQPLFCFTITMEAHGPWLPGRLTKEQMASCLPLETFGLFSLQTLLYLCHLSNTDRMLGMLLAAEKRLSRPVRLLVYGDHAPSLKIMEGKGWQ